MKFNMGCGFNKFEGYVNIDKFEACAPDLNIDLEVLPWPIETNIADEIVFFHSLEHLGQDTDIFLGIIKEIYRICKNNSKVIIHVPHPRHDNYIGDPTHVRVINPQVLSLFNKKLNLHWKNLNASNSQLAIYLDVDFETINTVQVLDPFYQEDFNKGNLSTQQLKLLELQNNNVVQEYNITLNVIK